jgi:hypothetical protein
MGCPIDRRRGGKDNVLDFRPHHGRQQRERSARIVGEVARRFFHRFAYGDESGEVNHGLAAAIPHQARERIRILQAHLEQDSGREIVPLPFGEVVHDGYVVALLAQQEDGMRSDISGAAGDQNMRFRHGKVSVRL